MMYPAVNMCFRPASWFFIVTIITMASNIYCNSLLNFFLEKLIQLIWRWYVLLHLHFLIHILAYQRCTLSLLCFCIFCFLPPFTLTTKFPLYTIHAWFSIATNHHCPPYPQRYAGHHLVCMKRLVRFFVFQLWDSLHIYVVKVLTFSNNCLADGFYGW